jgi:hypothetical protein
MEAECASVGLGRSSGYWPFALRADPTGGEDVPPVVELHDGGPGVMVTR